MNAGDVVLYECEVGSLAGQSSPKEREAMYKIETIGKTGSETIKIASCGGKKLHHVWGRRGHWTVRRVGGQGRRKDKTYPSLAAVRAAVESIR